MALRTYRAWARDLSPTWLRGTWGGALVEAIGFTFDSILEAHYEAGAADCLLAPTFPRGDALALKGAERQIERYPSDNDDQYIQRVLGAWAAWPQAGTKGGLLSQLDAGAFTAAIKEMADWNWDGPAATNPNWSRFWVVITSHGWLPTVWGGVSPRKWGAGVWGCDATQAEAHTLLRIVRKWKAAHTVAITVVVMEPTIWAVEQPDGTWADPANRSTSALYHYER